MRIGIELSNYRCFRDDRPARLSIEPGLTALVGINNSGKSALLRFLYEFRPLFEAFRNSNGALLPGALAGPASFPGTLDAKDPEETFNNSNNRPMTIAVSVPEAAHPKPPIEATRIALTINRQRAFTAQATWGAASPILVKNPSELRGTMLHDTPSGNAVADFQRLIEAFRVLSNTLYLPAFRNAVNAGGGGKLFDMTIGQPFVTMWRSLKTGNNKRGNEAADELTEDIRRVLGFQRLEIDPSEDSATLKLNIDGKPYRLEEVGSGIAQFVLVLVNAAVRRPAYVLIDEPELNLHPSLQLDFVATLNKYATSGIVFATHSLGLARTLAHRTYATRRSGADIERGVPATSEVYEYNDSPNLAELLGSLSYAAYKQLGFEQVLLVEGPSDVLVYQEFLRRLGVEHKVVILNLGGASGINGKAAKPLAEIRERICPNVRAIVDSERTSADGPPVENVSEFARVCTDLHVPCCVSKLRATENYFTARALASLERPGATPLQPYEKHDASRHGFRKDEGWRIARAMTRSELEATDIGAHLVEITRQLEGR